MQTKQSDASPQTPHMAEAVPTARLSMLHMHRLALCVCRKPYLHDRNRLRLNAFHSHGGGARLACGRETETETETAAGVPSEARGVGAMALGRAGKRPRDGTQMEDGGRVYSGPLYCLSDCRRDPRGSASVQASSPAPTALTVPEAAGHVPLDVGKLEAHLLEHAVLDSPAPTVKMAKCHPGELYYMRA